MNRRTPYLVAVCAMACLSGAVVRAEITTDGTMGAAQNLAGPDFVIPNTLGTQRGANLFHSFSQFNIAFDETAAFTSNFAGVTNNIFARVTGPNASTIDGALFSDVPGADLWLINPRGVMFGQGSSVDVLGSFFVSTADNVHFSDGTQFGADLSNAANSVLSVADPTSFGFLPANDGLLSLDGATILIDPEESLAVVGRIWRDDGFGGMLPGIQNTTIVADGGAVEIFSVGDVADGINEGTVAFDPNDGPLFDSGFDQLGALTIDTSRLINNELDATVQARVFIQGGELLVTGSEFNTQNLGDERGTLVGIRGTSNVTIDDNTRISADSSAGGGAGLIVVRANEAIEITGASQLGANSTGFANTETGLIRLSADESIRIDGGSTVSAGSDLNDPDIIEGVAAGGTIIVETPGLLVDQGARVSVDANDGNPDLGGFIEITADVVEVTNRAAISAATTGSARGGDVVINASESLFVSERASISASGFPQATGDAGVIVVDGGGNVELFDGGRIEANSFGAGRGGDIVLGDSQPLNSLVIDGFAPEEPASTDPSLLSYDTNRAPDFIFSSILGDFDPLTTDAEQLIIPRSLLGDVEGDVAFVAAFDNVINDQVPPDLVARTNFEVDDDSSPFGDGFAPRVRGFVADGDDLLIDVSQFPDFDFVGAPGAIGGDYAIGIQFAQNLPALASGISSVATSVGDGGSIFVNALSLSLTNFAEISVDNFGSGIGGDAAIGASDFFLADSARISANTASFGLGGNIVLGADFLTVLGSSRIEANSLADPALTVPFDPLTLDYDVNRAPDFVFATNQPNEVNDVGPLVAGAVSSLSISAESVNSPTLSFAYAAAFDNTVGEGSPDLIARSAENSGDDESPFGDGFAPRVLGIVRGSEAGFLDVTGFPDNGFVGDHEQSGDYAISFQFTPLPGDAGDIFIGGYSETFAESVVIDGGGDRATQFSTGVFSESRRNDNTPGGASGNIEILADDLQILGGAALSNASRSLFAGGEIFLEVSDLLVDGGSGIVAFALDRGAGGNIDILAENSVALFDGGTISASTGDAGQAGGVRIEADDIFLDNGFITSNAASAGRGGNAGFVTVIADTRLEITGNSFISSESEFVDFAQDGLQGNGPGLVELSAPVIEITGGSDVSVSTIDGQADLPGEVIIDAEQILVSGGGQISATTAGAGLGGDIEITGDRLEVSGRSGITATTSGTGTGGLIIVDSREVHLLNGGRIDVNTTGPGEGGQIFIGDDGAPIELLHISGTAAPLELDDISFNASQPIQTFSTLDPNSGLVPLQAGVAQSVAITREQVGDIDGDFFFFAAFDNEVDPMGLRPDLIARTEVDESDDSGFFGDGFAPALRGFAAAGEDILIDVSGFPDFDFIGDHDEAGGYNINLQLYTDLGERLGGVYSLTDGGLGEGGGIAIFANDIQVFAGGEITADTSGPADGGFIEIAAPTITLDGGSITANTLATGDGGFIDIFVDELNVLNGGAIRADATPDAGLVDAALQLGGVEVNPFAVQYAIGRPELVLSTLDAGIELETGVRFLNEGEVQSLIIDQLLFADLVDLLADPNGDFAFVAAFDNDVGGNELLPDLLASSNVETADVGTLGDGFGVDVRGLPNEEGDIEITLSGFPDFDLDGSHSESGHYELHLQIFGVDETASTGVGGDIEIRGLSSESGSAVSVNLIGPDSVILSNTTGIASAGLVSIESEDVLISQGARLASDTSGPGSGGDVDVIANRLIVRDDGLISASTSADGDGGSVELIVNELDLLSGGRVEATATPDIRFFNLPDPGSIFYDDTLPPDLVITTDGSFGPDAGLEPLQPGEVQNVSLNRNLLGSANPLLFAAAFDNDFSDDNADLVARTSFEDNDDDSPFGDGLAPVVRGFANSGDDINIDVSGFPDSDFVGEHQQQGDYAIALQFQETEASGNPGSAGDIRIEGRDDGAAVRVTIDGVSAADPELASGIVVIAAESEEGNLVPAGAGRVNITTSSLEVMNGGTIAANTEGDARDSGQIQLTVDNLTVDGGSVTATTDGAADAGDIFVDATGEVALLNNALVSSASDAQVTVGVDDPEGEGRAGNVSIVAQTLRVESGSTLSVETEDGGSGLLAVTADEILLDSGTISANTSGFSDGGSIVLSVDELQLTNGSIIEANSEPVGNVGEDIVAQLFSTSYDGTRDADAFFSSLAGDFDALTPGVASQLNLDVEDALNSDAAFIFVAAFDNALTGALSADLVAASVFEQDDDSSVFGDGLAPQVRGLVDNDIVSLLVSGFPDFQFEGAHSEQGDYAINVQFVPITTLPGSAGDVTIRGVGGEGTIAGRVLIDGSSVTSQSSSIGSAGAVNILADVIDVMNDGTVSTETTDGVGGNVTLNVDALTLQGAEITASTTGAGAAGSVVIEGTASPGNTLFASGARIASTSSAQATANAGSVTIDMLNVNLASNSEVTVEAAGGGAAGSIGISSEFLTLTSGTTVNVRSEQAQGGDITFNVGNLFRADSATVQASSNGQVKDDAGGNVTIRAARFVTLNNAQVRADAVAGSGGVIRVITDTFIRSADSVLTADSQQNQAGEITIDSVNDVSGTIVEIDEPDTELPKPVARRCTPAQVESRSSLAVRLVGEDAVESDYLATTEQAQSTPSGAASCGGGGPGD